MLRKRDQNVELQWPHLSFMLERIARMDRNETRFKKAIEAVLPEARESDE